MCRVHSPRRWTLYVESRCQGPMGIRARPIKSLHYRQLHSKISIDGRDTLLKLNWFL